MREENENEGGKSAAGYNCYVDIYSNIGKISIVPAFEVAKFYHEHVFPAGKKEGKIYYRTGEELQELFDGICNKKGNCQRRNKKNNVMLIHRMELLLY